MALTLGALVLPLLWAEGHAPAPPPPPLVTAGPALPEVNAVQNARMAALAESGRDEAFRRIYQIPGLQKVNQALGRLVPTVEQGIDISGTFFRMGGEPYDRMPS